LRYGHIVLLLTSVFGVSNSVPRVKNPKFGCPGNTLYVSNDHLAQKLKLIGCGYVVHQANLSLNTPHMSLWAMWKGL